ncbi:MAG: TIGR02302 family protein, partial [Alphaproteobacteria bacterium]|nr:TIGR02302 family protein [Alphaproteobacteria bacterium]
MSRFELWPAKRRRNDEPPTSAGLRFERLVTRSHAVLLIERLCRILLPPLIVAGLFICLAWSGLLLGAPSWARGLGLFALLFGLLGALLVPLKSFRWPTRREALARVDRATGLPHDPAAVLDDRLGNGGADPATRALWKLHRARAERAIDQLRTGGPEPRLPERDRFALRGLVLVGLVAMAFVAGPEKFARLQAAFDWRFTLADGPGYRVDAWIDPPAYTGKTPLVLKLAAGSFFTAPEPQKIEAPVGSIIVIHAPQGQLDLSFKGALAEAAKEKAGLAQGASVPAVGRPKETLSETRLALRGDATLALDRSGTPLGTFELHALPDAPPTIALSAVPKLNLRGSLTLKYKVADDYGVIRAEARFADPVLPGGRPTQRSLVEPPKMELRLPPPPDLSGEAETTADLSEHPWAGSRVKLTLVAQDEGGNEGKSETVEITLPQKPFSNPLARALVEQRRNLILAPDDRWRVGQALEALMIAPEAFKTSASAYLGLRVASDQLAAAHNDADLVAVADFLWAMALRLENGNLSEAERDLRAAESQLREALEHHAPEEEIRQLSENLRTALDKFLQQLAREQEPENNHDETAENGSNRSITPQQLQAMMDKMQAMMRDGDSEGAQRMLEQLQNILENLRTARPHQADPRHQAMRHALDELGQLSQDQQDLRDETYQNGQGERHRNREENGPLLGGPREPQTLMEFFAQRGHDGSRGGEAESQDRGNGKGNNPKEAKPSGGDPNAASDLGKRQQALR